MDKKELGRKIREIRKSKGLTQERLAELAYISEVYLGEIERGLKMPSVDIFADIISALDVSADYVLREELDSGKPYIFDEITKKLEDLTPKQRKTVCDIIDAYINNL